MKDIAHSEEVRKYSKLELKARQVVEGFITGQHKSPFHGFSVEFSEHRLYNKGESTKHIDWKLYGRSEKLFVKQFEEETNLRCQLVIDTSSSMYFPQNEEKSKMIFSIESAAAITHLLKMQRDAIGLSLFDEKVKTHYKAKLSATHIEFLYNELNKLQDTTKASKTTAVIDSLHEIAERIPRRSLVVIFSDMLDNFAESEEELLAALQHLKYNKHEVILFHVFDSKLEMNLDYGNRPIKFVDLENGTDVRLNPVNIQKKYREIRKKNFEEFSVKCGMYGVDYVAADIRKGFNDVMMSLLNKRQKMK